MADDRGPALRDWPESPGRRNEAAARVLSMIMLAAVSLAIGWPAAGAAQPSRPDTARTRTVIIEGMRFRPQNLIVRRGERVKWINKDPFPHTVTATDGRFDSHAIGPDGSWTYVARKAGEYDYTCIFHATMKGKLVVLDHDDKH